MASDFVSIAQGAQSNWKTELPDTNRPRPRVFGVGRYGIKKYSPQDPTRYLWVRVTAPLLAFALTLFARPATAQNSFCEPADAQTSSYLLCKPASNVEGNNFWGDKQNTNWDIIDTTLGVFALSTAGVQGQFNAVATSTNALNAAKVNRAGDTMTGQLTNTSTITVLGNAFSVGGSSFTVAGGSATVAYRLTAGSFVGNGAGLTGVSATSGGVDFSTITSALNTKLSSGAVPSGFVDFSTITTSLNTKLSSGAVPSGFVNFSTITASLNTKLSSGAAISGDLSGTNLSATVIHTQPGSVDFSTITTAIATKQNSFVGITSSCAAGYFLSSGTWVNGVVTGGGCVLAGTGSGGGSSTQTIAWVIDGFLHQTDGVNKNFLLSQTPSSSSSVFVFLEGLAQGTSAYTFSPPQTIVMTTAPASNSTSFFVQYTINTSTLPSVVLFGSTGSFSGSIGILKELTVGSTLTVKGNAFSVGLSSFTVGGGSATVAYQMSAGSFAGSGASLTGIPSTASIVGVYVQRAGDNMTGQLTLAGSTLTVGGNSFSVGGSSFTVAGGSATAAYKMTAGSFSGDGSGLTGFAVISSSYSAGAANIASVTFVGITTNTVVLRGSRPLIVRASTFINNTAATARTYTCQLSQNSILLDLPRQIAIGGTSTGIAVLDYATASSPSGSTTYALLCNSSSAVSAQTANVTYVTAGEF